MNSQEIHEQMKSLPDWKLITVDGIPQIQRTFTFPDFKQAMTFTDQVGVIAEADEHHPTILTEWGKVTVTWWTHTQKGLTPDDFNQAALTDAAYQKK
jgi:4a-hydroxytetrahydrobiopterin dehydratase